MPEMIPIASSSIQGIAYDEASLELQVEFREFGTYIYFGVPPVVYLNLLAAPSKGRFLNEVIRGTYRYRRVGGSGPQ